MVSTWSFTTRVRCLALHNWRLSVVFLCVLRRGRACGWKNLLAPSKRWAYANAALLAVHVSMWLWNGLSAEGAWANHVWPWGFAPGYVLVALRLALCAGYAFDFERQWMAGLELGARPPRRAGEYDHLDDERRPGIYVAGLVRFLSLPLAGALAESLWPWNRPTVVDFPQSTFDASAQCF